MTRSKWLPALLLAALAPLAAQAHTHLKEATPAEGSTCFHRAALDLYA